MGVIVYLDINGSVLYTQRQQIQPLIVFLSNLAGSVIGLLGTIGFLMTQFEGYYERYLANIKLQSMKGVKIKQQVMIKFTLYMNISSKLSSVGCITITYIS